MQDFIDMLSQDLYNTCSFSIYTFNNYGVYISHLISEEEKKMPLGDTTKIYVQGEDELIEVVVVGTDDCEDKHPVFERMSGPKKGQKILCSDCIFV